MSARYSVNPMKQDLTRGLDHIAADIFPLAVSVFLFVPSSRNHFSVWTCDIFARLTSSPSLSVQLAPRRGHSIGGFVEPRAGYPVRSPVETSDGQQYRGVDVVVRPSAASLTWRPLAHTKWCITSSPLSVQSALGMMYRSAVSTTSVRLGG